MHYSQCVAVTDTVYHEYDALPGIVLTKLVLSKHHVKQRSSAHELHDKTNKPIVLKDIYESDDVWMVDLFQDIDLCLQRYLVFFRHLALFEHLHSEPLASCSILALLYGSKATLTNR